MSLNRLKCEFDLLTLSNYADFLLKTDPLDRLFWSAFLIAAFYGGRTIMAELLQGAERTVTWSIPDDDWYFAERKAWLYSS
jgi:hypothetical protein